MLHNAHTVTFYHLEPTAGKHKAKERCLRNCGVQFVTQIIVTGGLDAELHRWLKALTKKLSREDAI